MLSPDYLQHVADELEADYYKLETEILKEIANRIKDNDYTLSSTAQWQIKQLRELGLSGDVIGDMLAKQLNISKDKIDAIIHQAVDVSLGYDNSVIKAAIDAGLLVADSMQSDTLKDVINKGIQSLGVELGNITNTTAITAQKVLKQALNKAYLQTQSGAFSHDFIINNAINDLAKQGLGIIEYRSGAKRQLDTTVRTAVRTAVSQTSMKAQEANLDDMDINLVETTSHWGARPTHAVWQGKVFWRKKAVDGYDNFYDATGIGTGAGLCGWNCRHSFYPFFEGLSSQSFEHFDEDENEEYYKRTQEQRYNERKIREWKRRKAVKETGGVDTTLETRKVREWRQRQAKLLKAHPELKRDHGREMVNKVFGKNKIKEYFSMDNITVKDIIKSSEESIYDQRYETALLYDTTGKLLLKKDGIYNAVEFTDDEVKLFRNGILTHNHPLGATFSPDDVYMIINSGLQEIRATGVYGTYVLRRNENLLLMPKAEIFAQEYMDVMYKRLADYQQLFKDGILNKQDANYYLLHHVMDELNNKYKLDYHFIKKERNR